jgi:hypothetical protein
MPVQMASPAHTPRIFLLVLSSVSRDIKYLPKFQARNVKQ